jgi:hypothetical protein
MEPQVINQEILLFTGSSLYSRKFCKRNNDNENSGDQSPMEELEKGCWDGMLHEILPELVGNTMQCGNSCIWNTASGVNFLCVNLGIGSTTIGKQTSIDPYFFLYGAAKTN